MIEKEINSSKNPTFKNFLKLERARGIKKQGRAIVSGTRIVKEVLEEFNGSVESILFAADHKPPPCDGVITSYRLAAELFNKLDFHKTDSPLLVVKVKPFPKWEDEKFVSGCILCVPFQDPANVGAVIRSAAAFGVTGIIMLKEAAHPFLPKSSRAAGSAIFRIPLYEGPSLERLNFSSAPLITLSPEGSNIENYMFPKCFYLVPGLEGPGLPDHLRGIKAISIPMERDMNSLNASMAVGITLYLWRRGSKLGNIDANP
jgi:tRNA G18 (ribose-2'-O)-methylase SpoU